MNSRMILSAIGNDRPGLTQALADAVHSAGGNWLESHLSHLGGQFVGAVLVELDSARIGELEAAVRGVDANGLHVTVVPAGESAASAAGEIVRIDLVGQDRPGIVREVTAALAPLGANIEDFVTVTENGAWSGELLFRASAKITVPAGTSVGRVQEALEAISADIVADLTITRPKGR
jgi:glycine cleavage system regulatory protein